ncbi:hypothetical protein GWC77_00590 [Paraburkholderia sp. NMBU_R16]|uniref:secretin N-terminal domain-containing protein n=1 Tax=Paraburkholderia sp. NMBU_R16 TaxID=2698676 RepID=UPI0015642D58|nr:secretin N-terminal domain-containing protein [Paraburkholderia sp. NMBU_R16]NRO94439.1 hypothetical protein [Paraburkholderia sp. NMBU_R16]
MKSVEWLRRCALALIGAIVLGAAGARAGESPHDGLDAPYAFQAAQSTPLDALDRFAKDHGLRLRVAAERGRNNGSWRTARLAGWLRAETGRDFLEQLARTHHFDWFVANRTLYVSARTASRVERMALGGLDPEAARAALAAVGLYEPRFGWGALPGQDAVLVGGPGEYRLLLRQFLAHRPTTSAAAEPQPMVFVLRHAQAADGPAPERGKASRPGVASILRQLLTGEDTHLPRHDFLPHQASIPDLPGLAAPTPLPLVDAIFPGRTGTAPVMPMLPDTQSSAPLPRSSRHTDVVVAADERTNTVLVWADVALRTRVAQLVEALDRPQPMVSIEVLVLETEDAALMPPASEHASGHGHGPGVAVPGASAAGADAQSDARWLNALAEHRARVLNRQRIVGFANRHLGLAVGAEEPSAPAPSSAPSADHANGRSASHGDALDLVARVLPAPPSGPAAIAVEIGLAMRQPTGLPGQEWASTSSTELTTAVVLESGAPPRLVAVYPVATSRTRQRAVLLSAHALLP